MPIDLGKLFDSESEQCDGNDEAKHGGKEVAIEEEAALVGEDTCEGVCVCVCVCVCIDV